MEDFETESEDVSENFDNSRDTDLRDAFEEVTGEEAPAKEPEQASRNGYPSFGLDKTEDETPAETIEPVAVPLSWAKTHKDEFKQLPPQVQKIIATREAEREGAFTRKMQELSENQRQMQELIQTVSPYQQQFALEGKPLPVVLKQMFEWHRVLETDPTNGLIALAQSYGIDPRRLAMQAPQVDPYTQQIQQKLDYLQSQLEQRDAQTYEHQYQSLESEVTKFAEQTDANGAPQRPYFLRVSADMQPIAQRLRAENPTASPAEILQEAYERACYADPDVRDALLAKQEAEQEAKRRHEAQAKAKAARRAGASVTGAPTGSSQPAKPDDLRGLLEASFNGGLN